MTDLPHGAGPGSALRVVGRGRDAAASLRLDDAGVVIDADAAAADLLGCRSRDLIGKPFVVFVGERHRRQLFAALREVRVDRTPTVLECDLASRDPVQIDASVALAPAGGFIHVAIHDVSRTLDPFRLADRLERTRSRQRELAATLDTTMRPRRALLPNLDVGAEPETGGDEATATPALHDWRLLPSGELFLLVVAGRDADPLHRDVARTVRETVRALVIAGHPPGELFARVERICGLREVGAIASAIAAFCAPDGSRAVIVSAGGPSALVRRSDGHVERLPARGLGLGEPGSPSRPRCEVELSHGDTLVLRVVAGDERDRAWPDAAELEGRLGRLKPQELGGAATARQLVDPRIRHGTVAILCAVRGSTSSAPSTSGEHLCIRLHKDEMRDVGRSRREIAAWLAHRAVRSETIERALLVVSELATNAVVAAAGRAELWVSVSGGAVLLEVMDDGDTWHPEAGLVPHSGGGHGLRVASSLCEDLHVASSGAGTVIRARVGVRAMR